MGVIDTILPGILSMMPPDLNLSVPPRRETFTVLAPVA